MNAFQLLFYLARNLLPQFLDQDSILVMTQKRSSCVDSHEYGEMNQEHKNIKHTLKVLYFNEVDYDQIDDVEWGWNLPVELKVGSRSKHPHAQISLSREADSYDPEEKKTAQAEAQLMVGMESSQGESGRVLIITDGSEPSHERDAEPHCNQANDKEKLSEGHWRLLRL